MMKWNRSKVNKVIAAVCVSALLTGVAGPSVWAEDAVAEEQEAVSGQETASAEGAAAEEQEAVSGQETASAEGAAAEGRETASAEEDYYFGLPQICMYQVSEQEWSPELEQYLVQCSVSSVTLTPQSAVHYPKLAEKLEKLNEKRVAKLEKRYKKLKKEAEEAAKERGDMFGTFTDSQTYYVQRADSNIVSLLGVTEGYTGGAHGYYGYTGLNLDAQTGKRLKLKKLVKDKDAFMGLLKDALLRDYPDIDEDLFKRYFEKAELSDLTWTAGWEGITCYFDPYTLGAYAIGPQIVTIPYAGNEALFEDKLQDRPEEYGAQLPLATEMLMGGHKVNVYGERTEYDDYSGFTVICDGQKATLDDTMAYGVKATWLHAGSGDYLYLDCMEDNDYHSLEIVKLGDTPEHVGSDGLGATYVYEEPDIRFGEAALTDPAHMSLTERSWLLGTASGVQIFRVGSDGMPVGTEGSFRVSGERTLTLKKEMTFDLVGENGETGGSRTLPSGTTLKMYRTDNSTYMDLLCEDGAVVRVMVQAEDWPQTINGEPISDIFDGILFAG